MSKIKADKFEIENINETFNGVKYAYEKEGVYDTEFIADCIEYGERFVTTFYALNFIANQTLWI